MDEREKEGQGKAPTATGDEELRDPTPEGSNGLATEESGGEAPPEAGPPSPEVANAALRGELQELNDRFLRLAAEFDNYRKRVERERSDQHARSQAALVGRLLDVLDDLQRVEHLDPATATPESLFQALELLERKFRQALESAGLEEVNAVGEPFDPRFMEAVMAMPVSDPAEDEIVADVFRKGYRFGNTLVRPAQVRVKKYEG